MKKDYYKTLGVKKKATPEQIKEAYRNKSKIHHPDKGGDAEEFKELAEAYEVLSDPEKRECYDKYGVPIDKFEKALGDVLAQIMKPTQEDFILEPLDAIGKIRDRYVGAKKSSKDKLKALKKDFEELKVQNNGKISLVLQAMDKMVEYGTRAIEDCELTIKACDQLEEQFLTAKDMVGRKKKKKVYTRSDWITISDGTGSTI